MMLLSLPMTSHEWHEQHQRSLRQLTALNTKAVGPLGLLHMFAGTSSNYSGDGRLIVTRNMDSCSLIYLETTRPKT